jgi:hypothetical protein
MQWSGRGIGLLLLLLCAGLALTLETRVEVPGLSRLLPTIDGSSELFDAPARRNGPDREVVGEGKVMVPDASDQTIARARVLPLAEPTSASTTLEPAAQRRAVTGVQPTKTTPPSVQSSPTRETRPTGRPRNPNAADPGENPNAQGPPADPPGHAKGKGKAGSAPSPETEVEPATS